MSAFKQYSKMAKERLKSGFWENARRQIAHEKEVAATLGLDGRQVVENQRRKLEKQIYDYDGFCQDEVFNQKVREILQSDQLVLNPLMRLADQKYMQTLSPEGKQTYLSKLGARYRKAVEAITGKA